MYSEAYLNLRSLSDCDSRQVNWNQTALDSNYKDAKNARAMWKRLAKKLADAPAAAPGAPPAAAARAAEGDEDNAGDGTAKTSVTAGKKRKAAGTPEGDSSPTEGMVSIGA